MNEESKTGMALPEDPHRLHASPEIVRESMFPPGSVRVIRWPVLPKPRRRPKEDAVEQDGAAVVATQDQRAG